MSSRYPFNLPTVVADVLEPEDLQGVDKVRGMDIFIPGDERWAYQPIYIYYLADGTVCVSQVADEFVESFVRRVIVKEDWSIVEAALEAEQLMAFGYSVRWSVD